MTDFCCRLCQSTNSKTVVENIRDWEFGVEGDYSYRQCQACNNIQLHPFPDLELLKKAYPENYTAHVEQANARGCLYSLLYKINHAAFARKLKGKLKTGARVLDAGCGNGELLLQLKTLGASELNGVDFSEQACQLAEKNGIQMFHGLYLDMPREQQSLDAVFMMNYLEHVEHPMDELKKTWQLLDDNGWLIGECPNFGSVDQKLFGRYWGGNHVPRHTFQYSAKKLQQMLTEAGFSEVIIRQEPNPSILAISLQNWLQRQQPDLKNNPRLQKGRMPGFSLLMIALLPVNILFTLFGGSGIITFYARK